MEVLDLIEERTKNQDPATAQGRLAHIILELCTDAEETLPFHIVADALIQALATYVLSRRSNTPNGRIQPRIAVQTLKAHFARIGSQMIGGSK